jgi:FixJ family two-component response regulator
MSAFTVFLLDDDGAVLKAVDRLLQAAGYTTKTYCSGEAFLSEQDASTPGCLVLDLAMPGLNGLAVQEALALRGIDRPIIFLTGQGTIPESVQAMRAGAVDFLTKPIGRPELLTAIRCAEERDKTQRDSETRHKIVRQKVAKLTRRERQVLALVVAGLLNKLIAHELGVRLKPIKVHRGRVHEKMGVRSLAELVRMTMGIPLRDTSDIVGPSSSFKNARAALPVTEGCPQARPRRRMSAFGP